MRPKRLLIRCGYVLLAMILLLGIIAWLGFQAPQASHAGAPPQSQHINLAADTLSGPDGKTWYATSANNLLQQTLHNHVDTNGLVDYAALTQDRQALDLYLHTVAYLDPHTFNRWSEKRQLAFWINVYNACTLQIICDYYPIGSSLYGLSQRALGQNIPPGSIRNLPFVWEKTTFHIMNQPLTLNHIEHQIIRGNFQEARIHMAINCASNGCPPLRHEIYTEHTLYEQLEEQTRHFLLMKTETKVQIDRSKDLISLSPILQWFAHDFVANNQAGPNSYTSARNPEERAVLIFISRYLPQEDADYIRTQNYTIHYRAYDWSLNQRIISEDASTPITP